jgi:hypothetical protein
MASKTRKMLREFESEGWVATYTKGQHVKLVHPTIPTHPIFTSSTPSDRRASLNLRAQLRRALQGKPL